VHSVSASFGYIIKILIFIIAVSYDHSHAYDQFKSKVGQKVNVEPCVIGDKFRFVRSKLKFR
jgi:hypothetical protein